MSLPGVNIERSGARRIVKWKRSDGASLRVDIDVRRSVYGGVRTSFWSASVDGRPVDGHDPLAEQLFVDASRLLRAAGEDRP